MSLTSSSFAQVHTPDAAHLQAAEPATRLIQLLRRCQVRHPGVGTAISRDFELMMAAASVAELLPSMKRLRLRDSLRQFAAPLQEQVLP